MSDWQKENVATMAISAALVLGLYAMGAGGNSFWGLSLLLNLSYPKSEK